MASLFVVQHGQVSSVIDQEGSPRSPRKQFEKEERAGNHPARSAASSQLVSEADPTFQQCLIEGKAGDLEN